MLRFFSRLCLVSLAGSCAASSTSNKTTGNNDTVDASGAVGSGALDNAACQAIIRYDQRCADSPEARSATCASARMPSCDKTTPTMSTAYHDAVVACFTATVACGDTDACIDEKLAKVTPSAAMAKVRDDYCTTCGADAGSDCAGNFFRVSQDLGNGDGIFILQVSEDVARGIDSQCTGSSLDVAGSGATSCRDAFLQCAMNVLENARPSLPDPCFPPPPPDDDAGQAGQVDSSAAPDAAAPDATAREAGTDGGPG